MIPPAPVSTPTERIDALEVPVFAEVPERRPDRPLTPADIAAIQQQQ